jgi:hypothetical protein
MSLKKQLLRAMSPPTFAHIFGAGYYDDFDFGDASSLTLAGSAITTCVSKVSARALTQATGINRPTIQSNQINGKSVARFDGTDDFFTMASSNSLYNFLHTTTGGFLLAIYKTTDANPNTSQGLFMTASASTDTGTIFAYDDTSGSGRSDAISMAIYRGSGATALSIVNNLVVPQQFNIISAVFDGGNATIADRLIPYANGVQGAKSNASSGVAASGNSSNNLFVGKRPSGVGFVLKGDLARLIVIAGAPTAEQVWQAHNRLNFEYGTFPI